MAFGRGYGVFALNYSVVLDDDLVDVDAEGVGNAYNDTGTGFVRASFAAPSNRGGFFVSIYSKG